MTKKEDLDVNFRDWVADNGAPRESVPLTAEQNARLSTFLPAPLMEFFRLYGLGTWFDGLFRFCDPQVFRPILALLFKGDKILSHQDCHVIGYSGFGVLTIWSEKLRKMRIDLPSGLVWSTVIAPTNFAGIYQPARDLPKPDTVAWTVLPLDARSIDYDDFEGKPMFTRCRRLYGDLEPDEIYGFVPALALAGSAGPARCVENIRRVKSLEHFAILAQMDEFQLARMAPGGRIEAVRVIG